MALLGWLNRRLSLSIPLFLVLGFIFGLSFDAQFLLYAITPLTLIMIYPMMVGVRLRQLFQPGGNTVQGWPLAVNFILIPLVAYGLGLVFFFRPHWWLMVRGCVFSVKSPPWRWVYYWLHFCPPVVCLFPGLVLPRAISQLPLKLPLLVYFSAQYSPLFMCSFY